MGLLQLKKAKKVSREQEKLEEQIGHVIQPSLTPPE
jgi:hypothetical protein